MTGDEFVCLLLIKQPIYTWILENVWILGNLSLLDIPLFPTRIQLKTHFMFSLFKMQLMRFKKMNKHKDMKCLIAEEEVHISNSKLSKYKLLRGGGVYIMHFYIIHV